MEGALLPNHAPEHQRGGDILGYNGSQGHSGHAHLQRDDKQQVEPHVDHAGKGEEIQRPLGVPLGPKDGRAKVIHKVGGQAQKVDPQIHTGQVDNVGGRGGPLQQLPCQRHAQQGHHHAAG